MALDHLTAVLEHSAQRGARLIVLLIVAFYSDPRGEWTVDQATLQRRARLGRRRVQQILDELEAAGELAVVSHHGRGKLSTFRLLVEAEKTKQIFGLRPLTEPQSAVFRINLLLEEAGAPLPSPAQIGLWSKTLGGIEPLLDLLGRLVQAGLANKRQPIAYVHRVVMEHAARPEPRRPLDARAGRDLLWAAGADEIRWQQALEIIADAEVS